MIIDTALFYGFGAAFLFAIADMSARYGVQHAHPIIGATVSRFVSVLVLIIIAFLAGARFPEWGVHYLWVAAGGALSPGLFAVLLMFGISKIGVSRAVPIKGCAPLFAVLFAFVFLGERTGIVAVTGVVLIVAGIFVLTSGKTEGRWRRIDALWPIAAAASTSLGAVFWRKGLPIFPDAMAGAVVGMMAAFLIAGVYFVVRFRHVLEGDFSKAWPPFVIMGIAAGFASFCYSTALQKGEVYRIVSLIETSPLITVAFAIVLLRQAELITWRIPLGAVIIVAGAILVNFRG